jgi:di/tricarboxylate transporter
VVLFIWNRLPIGIVAIAVALALWATGLLTLNQSLAGFGDPVVIFIARCSSSARRSMPPA